MALMTCTAECYTTVKNNTAIGKEYKIIGNLEDDSRKAEMYELANRRSDSVFFIEGYSSEAPITPSFRSLGQPW